MGATMLLSATSNDVSVNVRLVGWLSPDTSWHLWWQRRAGKKKKGNP